MNHGKKCTLCEKGSLYDFLLIKLSGVTNPEFEKKKKGKERGEKGTPTNAPVGMYVPQFTSVFVSFLLV